MDIKLARIDDRLIHGQVVTSWVNETQAEMIIVCAKEVADDSVRKSLLKQVAPSGVTVNVASPEKTAKVYHNPKYQNVPVLILFTNPLEVLQLIEAGVPIQSVNIGGMAFQEGKNQVTHAVSVNQEDIESFNKLYEKGVELEIRKVASDSKKDIISLLK